VLVYRFLKKELLEVNLMALIKGKKDKLAIRPTEGKTGELTPRRPYDVWTDMDQLFDQFRMNFNDLLWRPNTSLFNTFDDLRTPMMDVADLGNRYEMKLEIPGIPKENINIEVSQTGIEISANHETEENEDTKNWLRRERSSTSFYRSIEFPDKIKTDTVDAEFKDGVLNLILPKAEPKPEIKSTKVKIK
jgi:HSP20 family protein